MASCAGLTIGNHLIRTGRRLGVLLVCIAAAAAAAQVPAQSIDRESLQAELRPLQDRMAALRQDPAVNADHWADIQVFLKGAVWALDLEPGLDFEQAQMVQHALQRASERMDALAAGKPLWAKRRGRLVRGFISAVDGSTQPYGLVIPAHYDPQQPMRLDIVLHGSHGGRASGLGDLQFISQFDQGDGPADAPQHDYIEVHPMGRLGENAYRFEGETDIDEAVEAVCRHYAIDRRRIVLRGSSLGGVGTWQIGLKRPDRFVALGPTAGPVDTLEFANSPWPHFERLEPLTPWQKRMLHLVDAIDYTANAGMVPVVAAMGDQDPYYSSHLLIEKAFQQEGIPFTGLVDVGGGHGVSAPVIEEQLRLLGQHAAVGRCAMPHRVRFVTWTLKFSRCYWVEILGLEKHYERAEFDAQIADDGSIVVATARNITRFAIVPAALPRMESPLVVRIGGTTVPLPGDVARDSRGLVFEHRGGQWQFRGSRDDVRLSGKRPGLQGPIDDAFCTPFLCVRGTGQPWNPAAGAWADANLRRFAEQWRRHYRGDLPVKRDVDVTADDVRRCNLILFGDPGSNRWIREIAPQLPLVWDREHVQLGGKTYSAVDHAPALIAPNPLSGAEDRYVVFNSGHTYHDRELRFSYMVFPRLGDWAIMKLHDPASTTPTPAVGETVLTSGFFSEQWDDAEPAP